MRRGIGLRISLSDYHISYIPLNGSYFKDHLLASILEGDIEWKG
jgi:hypothetical protein